MTVARQPGDRVIYRPLSTRSPALLGHDGDQPVVVRVADDGRAMLLFADLTLAAAVPAEFTPDAE